jgi:hypothetical protein
MLGGSLAVNPVASLARADSAPHVKIYPVRCENCDGKGRITEAANCGGVFSVSGGDQGTVFPDQRHRR